MVLCFFFFNEFYKREKDYLEIWNSLKSEITMKYLFLLIKYLIEITLIAVDYYFPYFIFLVGV